MKNIQCEIEFEQAACGLACMSCVLLKQLTLILSMLKAHFSEGWRNAATSDLTCHKGVHKTKNGHLVLGSRR